MPNKKFLSKLMRPLLHVNFYALLLGIFLFVLGLSKQSIASPNKAFHHETFAGIPDVTNPNTKLIIITDSAVANGSATNSVEAHVVDILGNPVTNQQVVFTINGASGGVGANTDANGYAVITLTSTIAGIASITAKVIGLPIVFGSPAQVVFIPDAPDPVASLLTVVTTGAIANGTATNSLKAHITDDNGNAIADSTVTFTIVSGTGTIIGSNTVTTDANGNAVITLKSTVVGAVGVTASIDGINITGSPATVNFVAGPPDVTVSTTALSVVTTGATANGTSTNSVKAHITDVNGNPVANQTIVFAIASGTGTFVGSATVTTDASGNATITLTSTVAGNANITATVNGNNIPNGSPAIVQFVAGAPTTTAPTTALSVVTTGATADGASTNSVKAHITDANGNPVANQSVVFAIASGAGTFVGSATVTTDASGNATITLTSTVAGNVNITATIGGNNITNGSPATVQFVVGAPSTTAPTTALSVVTTGATANGTATNSVQAHITDANGNPIANQSVVFAISSGTGTFVGSATVTTNASGNAIITLTSTVVGSVSITATIGGNNIPNGSPATVQFVVGAPSTTAPTTALSVVTTGATADGTSTNSVKAHITDASGNPVPNQTVVFAIASGTGTFVGSTTVTTDASGNATITLTSTVAGNVNITATVNGNNIPNGSPATVQFVVGAPSTTAPTTALSVVTTGATANGTATNSVKAHITDANGNPVANQTVVFAIASGTGTFVGSTTVTTDASGNATITLTSTVAGSVNITATVNGNNIPNGSPATVQFVVGAPSTTAPTTALSVVTTGATANGTATNSVKAHITDANGNPVANQTVVFAIASGTGTFVGSTTVTTDASGNATITLTSTVAGNVNITATVNGNNIPNGSPATVQFVVGAPSTTAPTTALSVVTTGATANGTATNSVKAHITDANGNPVANQTIVFAIASGTGTFVGSTTVTTDASGNATITLTSTVAGNVNITATVNGNNIPNGSPATVQFVVGAPNTTVPTTALSVVTTGATANGTATNSVKAHITDASGNPVANQTIVFTIASGTGTFVGSATVTTDASGNATITLTSTVAGSVNITATVNGNNIPNGSPATVQFVVGAPSTTAPTTALSVVTTNAAADGTATNSVKAHITDANGNPVPNQTVVFAIASGTGTFVGSATVTTDANGNATITLTSTVAGSVGITAKVNGNNIPNGSPATVQFLANAPNTTVATTALSVVTTGATANGTATNSVKAHITDVNGNPVANQTIVFTIASGTGTFVGSATVTTDASGNATITLTSTVAGNVNITATVNGNNIPNGSPAIVQFVTGAPTTSAPTTALSVVTNNAIANGTATSSVKAHITDANGNPIANQSVIFAIASGTGTFVGSATVTTDASGNATITLTSTVTGNVNITATINGNNVTNGSPAIVTFVSGTPDLSNAATKLTVVTNGALANGTATNSVKAHIADANGNPVANQSVVFVIASGTGTFVGSATVTTDASGNATITLTSTVPGNVNITATVNGNNITNGSPATVQFVVGAPSTTAPTTALSVVTNNASSNGVATNSVKAHITDASGNAVPNQSVVFAIASGAGTFVGSATVTTDANGNASISLTSTVAGNVNITATVNGNTITNGSPAMVTFTVSAPDVTDSATKLIVVKTGAAANGVATNSVKAHVTDQDSMALAGQPVIFTIASGTGTIVGSSTVTTDANGDAIITLTSTVVGNVNITATVGGNSITFGSPAIVQFVADSADLTDSATRLIVVTTGALADGVATNSVKAHIIDKDSVPVAGLQVMFVISSGSGAILTPQPVVTDANGDAIITITSTVAGNVGITATVGGTAITFGSPAVVQFVAGPADTSSNTTALSVVKNDAAANGSATNSVKAHITDKNGNPVANQQVIFSIASGNGTFVGSDTVTTDTAGNAIIKLTSTVADTVGITATVNGDSIINGSPATVIFTNQADITNPNTALIVVVGEAIADGQATTSVKAHLVDQNGNVLPGQDIVFAIDSGSGTIITPQPVTTDVNGDASIQITSTKPGYVLITAKIGDSVSIVNGSPARVKFVPVNIYVPKVFTPNGDGTNDILKPILVGISTFHYWSIYNRWGNLIYTSQDPNSGWDGRYKGVAQPVETYLWVAEGVDNQGKTIVQKGMVSLVR